MIELSEHDNSTVIWVDETGTELIELSELDSALVVWLDWWKVRR